MLQKQLKESIIFIRNRLPNLNICKHYYKYKLRDLFIGRILNSMIPKQILSINQKAISFYSICCRSTMTN